jgi:hypothetical protein
MTVGVAWVAVLLELSPVVVAIVAVVYGLGTWLFRRTTGTYPAAGTTVFVYVTLIVLSAFGGLGFTFSGRSGVGCLVMALRSVMALAVLFSAVVWVFGGSPGPLAFLAVAGVVFASGCAILLAQLELLPALRASREGPVSPR